MAKDTSKIVDRKVGLMGGALRVGSRRPASVFMVVKGQVSGSSSFSDTHGDAVCVNPKTITFEFFIIGYCILSDIITVSRKYNI
jgi:hypothetical protein